MNIVQIATQIFSILSIVCQITILILLVSYSIKSSLSKRIISFFGKHALLVGFLIVLVATLGSLFYSEIAHFEPCKLCWYQRILMYSQVLLLGRAYLKKDKQIASYSLLFSSVGAAISFYHYLLQRGTIQDILPCSAVGYSVSCTQKFVMTDGYITIPMMALSAFLLLCLIMIARKRTA